MKTHQSYHEPGDVVLAAWQEQVEQAQEKPWLAALLLRQGERILRRFAYFYERLRALPRNTRRTIQKKLATTLAGAALLMALAGPAVPAAHAATIAVNPGSAGVNGSDGGCSLVEAILTANTGSYSSGDCSGGTAGTDTITLAGNTYSYTAAYGGSMNALPTISSQLTIEANNATIQRTGGGSFRILEVTNTGDLTLNNATISGGSLGPKYNNGGGIRNNGGTLTINNSTISNNSVYSFGGGIHSQSGDLTINNSTISGNSATGPNGDGGGIYIAYGGVSTISINDCTITGNSGVDNGGGIYIGDWSYTITAMLNRTIISGNTTGNSGNEFFNAYGYATVYGGSYNLFGTNNQTTAEAIGGFTPYGSDLTATSDGTDPTALSSILNTTLANNGSQSHTFTHALVSGSPAIDVIPTTDTNCNPGSSVDQRGGARANGVNQGGNACDIGAFEYASSQTPTAITMSGLTARIEGRAGPSALGATGVLALLTGGWLARARRRKM